MTKKENAPRPPLSLYHPKYTLPHEARAIAEYLKVQSLQGTLFVQIKGVELSDAAEKNVKRRGSHGERRSFFSRLWCGEHNRRVIPSGAGSYTHRHCRCVLEYIGFEHGSTRYPVDDSGLSLNWPNDVSRVRVTPGDLPVLLVTVFDVLSNETEKPVGSARLRFDAMAAERRVVDAAFPLTGPAGGPGVPPVGRVHVRMEFEHHPPSHAFVLGESLPADSQRVASLPADSARRAPEPGAAAGPRVPATSTHFDEPLEWQELDRGGTLPSAVEV